MNINSVGTIASRFLCLIIFDLLNVDLMDFVKSDDDDLHIITFNYETKSKETKLVKQNECLAWLYENGEEFK